jgi:hypothetical protein
MIVYNHDVVGLYDRINRFLEEVNKSVSASGSYITDPDKNRLRTYLAAVQSYHDWVMSAPELDLPETHPREYTLKEVPVLAEPESEIVDDIQRMMVVMRDELTNSQSARMHSKLNVFDSARLIAVVEKVNRYLTDYVEQATPLDLPESSPAMLMTGPGRTGT